MCTHTQTYVHTYTYRPIKIIKMSLDIDRCPLGYKITASWIHYDTTMFLLCGEFTQIEATLTTLGFLQPYHWCCNYLSLTASPKFFSSKCKKLHPSRKEIKKLSLLCSFLQYFSFTLSSVPSAQCKYSTSSPFFKGILASGYLQEGREKESSYFQFELCAPEVWLIEWLDIS